MISLCLAVFAAGGLVLPPPSMEKPPEGGTLAYLGFDRVCHNQMPAFAKLFKCPSREPAIDAALSALDGESLAAVGAAAVEKALRAALDAKQQGEIDLVFIDTKQRVYWVDAPGAARHGHDARSPNFELKDKAHTFLLLLANVLRKLQLDAPLLVKISRHTPNEKGVVVQDAQRDGLGALLHATLARSSAASTLLGEQEEGSAPRIPLLEMHIRAKDLRHGFGIPSVLLSWMATALYPWPRRLRRLIAEANVREGGSAAAKRQLKQRKRRRRARRRKEGSAAGRAAAEGSDARLVPWKRRTAKVVWRGGTTGMRSFLRLPKAMRLEALRATSRARLMSAVDDVAERTMGARALSSILDIGYHKVHDELHALRDRVTGQSDVYTRVDGELGDFVEWLDAHKLPFVSTVQQAAYKYQLSVDGLAAPWRLSLQLVLGGAILKQEGSLFHEMYQPRLEAGTHYLPLNRSLADLAHVAAWAVENDASAARIAKAAKEFARTWLSAEALACYVARLLVTLSEKQKLPEEWRPPERVAHLTLVFDPDRAAEEPRHLSLAKHHARGSGRRAESKQCRAAKRDGTLREAKRDAATAVLDGFVEGKPKPKLAATLVAPAKLCEQHCHGFIDYNGCFQMCRRDNCRGMCKGLGAL